MHRLHLLAIVLVIFTSLELNAFSIFNRSRRPNLSRPLGYVPNWAQSCVEAETNDSLEDLGDVNRCTSKGYTGYMDNLDYFSRIDFRGNYIFNSIESVHVVVTDARLDVSVPDYGHCRSKMCYRAYVYVNGDEETGEHVATWVVTPGMPWTDRSGGNYTPESLSVYLNSPKKNQNSKGDFLLQNDNEMGLAGRAYGKFPGYFVMDFYVNSDGEDMPWSVFYHFGIAFHASYTVNGDVGSHGCTRLKYIESKKMNYLARHVGRRFSVETRFTERSKLSAWEQKETMLQLGSKRMDELYQLKKEDQKSVIDLERFLFDLN